MKGYILLHIFQALLLDSLKMSFSPGDLIWAKVRGYPHWPARVSSIYFEIKADESWAYVEVQWGWVETRSTMISFEVFLSLFRLIFLHQKRRFRPINFQFSSLEHTKRKLNKFISLQYSGWSLVEIRCNARRIYTTLILGTALQNFGTRASRFGHGPLDLHGKICSSLFNVDFRNGTTETETALLNLWVPALITAVHIWFQARFRRAFADRSKNHGRFSSAKSNCMARCVEKAELRDETRPSLAPLLRALKRRQHGLLQAILGCI